jgi:hypothetical protein
MSLQHFWSWIDFCRLGPSLLVVRCSSRPALVAARPVGSDRGWTGHGASTMNAPQMTHTCRDRGVMLKIRLVRSRDCGVLSGIVFMPVLGAHLFVPIAGAAPISYGRGPRHREDAFILDREMKL